MRTEYRRLVILQGVITIIVASIAYFMISPVAAKSVAYGGSVVMVSALFLEWRHRKGGKETQASAEWHLRYAYRAALERFIWVVVMLFLGFKFLNFEPAWLLIGFLGGQAAWLAVPIWMRVENVK